MSEFAFVFVALVFAEVVRVDSVETECEADGRRVEGGTGDVIDHK